MEVYEYSHTHVTQSCHLPTACCPLLGPSRIIGYIGFGERITRGFAHYDMHVNNVQ